jgi:hypothetical protein
MIKGTVAGGPKILERMPLYTFGAKEQAQKGRIGAYMDAGIEQAEVFDAGATMRAH